jgi:hypothetical protein
VRLESEWQTRHTHRECASSNSRAEYSSSAQKKSVGAVAGHIANAAFERVFGREYQFGMDRVRLELIELVFMDSAPVRYIS